MAPDNQITAIARFPGRICCTSKQTWLLYPRAARQSLSKDREDQGDSGVFLRPGSPRGPLQGLALPGVIQFSSAVSSSGDPACLDVHGNHPQGEVVMSAPETDPAPRERRRLGGLWTVVIVVVCVAGLSALKVRYTPGLLAASQIASARAAHPVRNLARNLAQDRCRRRPRHPRQRRLRARRSEVQRPHRMGPDRSRQRRGRP
jgi:hypothetical protein